MLNLNPLMKRFFVIRLPIVVSFLIYASGIQCQNLVDSTFQNDCNQVKATDYDFVIIGKDTLEFFMCSKTLSHYALDKSPCYTGDVIFPKSGKKKNDFYNLQLANYIIAKYHLYEIRVFKSCRVRYISYMSIVPPDPIEQNKIEREKKQSIHTYRRSIVAVE